MLRQFHVYFGVFIAPSILFFALTGALQLFGLHESHEGYKPPEVVEKLGRLHMKQTYALKPVRPVPAKAAMVVLAADPGAAPAAAPPVPRPEPAKAPAPSVQRLKWLFLAVSLGLIVSTLLGIWMALVYSRRKIVTWLLLLAGAAAPVAIILL